MNVELFKSLINKTEGTTLDFKRNQYPLIGDKNDIETAKFVKDIISFANTKRNTSAYIIIGIGEIDNTKELCGLDVHIDEATFQSKIRDKVYPIPSFSYFTFKFEQTTFGIFEIPIAKYNLPITPTIKLKGLSPGVVYFRRGSKNDEAKSLEVIQINEWINGPNRANEPNIKNDISLVIADINNKNDLFSKHISKALLIALKLNDSNLETLLRNELNGWRGYDGADDLMKHRQINVLLTQNPVTSIINRGGKSDINNVWNELKANKAFTDKRLGFADSLSELEDMLEGYKRDGGNSLYNRTIKGQQILGENSDYANEKFYIYYTASIIMNLYSRTRQTIVSALMKHI